MTPDKPNSYDFLEDIVFYSVEKTEKFRFLREKKRTSIDLLQQKFESSSLKDTFPLQYMDEYYNNTLFDYLGDDIKFESAAKQFDSYRNATYEEFWLEFSKYVWPGYMR